MNEPGPPMRITYLTAGAAGMYCGSCMHDNTLARALTQVGADVQLVPMYTPIRTDEADVSIDRVFFGGINVYLQQRVGLFRYLPQAVDRLLDSPALLRWVGSRGVETSAAQLGELTLSMLRGSAGFQRKEVRRLGHWLTRGAFPDLVVFSNVLVAGCVPDLKRAVGAKIAVTLQGDDLFLDELPPPYKRQALEHIRRLAEQVDAFLQLKQPTSGAWEAAGMGQVRPMHARPVDPGQRPGPTGLVSLSSGERDAVARLGLTAGDRTSPEFILARSLRRDCADHAPPMLLRDNLNLAKFGQLLDDILHDAPALLHVRHLASTKDHRHLNLVLVLEEPRRLLHLEADVVFSGLGAKADFLRLGVTLILAGFFLLLVLVLAVVHDAAYGRPLIRSHLDQIEVDFICPVDRFLGGQNTQLLAVLAYHPDWGYANLVVDAGLQAVYCHLSFPVKTQ